MTVEAPPTMARPGAASPGWRRWSWRIWSWRIWTAIGVAVAVIAAGAVTGTLLVRHYRYAPVLDAYGFGWVGPAATRSHESSADLHSQSTVPATGRRQVFFVEVDNNSSVTQTILGLDDSGGPTVRAPRLRAALVVHGQPQDDLHYGAQPLRVAPHQTAVLHVSVRSACLSPGGEVIWDSLAIRVHVGSFTRTENVGFGGQAMAIRGTAASDSTTRTACQPAR